MAGEIRGPSALFHFYLFLCLASVVASQTLPNNDQKRILLRIKREWGGEPALDSWNVDNSTTYCDWPGVGCAADGFVVNITLSDQTWTRITRPIPASLCDLKNLTHLDLSYQRIHTRFPTSLYNCSSLRYLDLKQNGFVGAIPADIDRLSPRITLLDLSGNNFTGDIPPSIGRLPAIQTLWLYANLFDGSFPAEIGNLSRLQQLGLAYNSFAPMRIPSEFGNLTKLTFLWMTKANLQGEIPASFAQLTGLTQLDLTQNSLTGAIPAGIWGLPNLQYLYLYKNNLSGSIIIDGTIGALGLVEIDLSMNLLTGSIPDDFGKLKKLSLLDLYYNRLSGVIPASIGKLPSLSTLRLFNNGLTGVLPPELGKNSPLIDIEVNDNMISGELPDGLCDRGAFNSIVVSNNNLTGRIPPSLGKYSPLKILFVNGNQFSGEVPDGIWAAVNLTILVMNDNAFSGMLPHKLPPNLSWKRRHLAAWTLTPFHSLDFTKSDIVNGIREENIIGVGGAGKVYRVTLGNRASEIVAAKKIWNGGNLAGRLEKQFQAELQILGSIRHKNIIKLLCCCSSLDSKLLVYEYMENASLHKWLHRKHMAAGGSPHETPLDWPRRLEIAIGSARGLCYIHHDCSPPIIHRDVKSSNILLDSEFNVKIADFGLARMVAKPGEPDTVSVVAGSHGYIAPECGYSRRLNEKVDVYSFGVVLLELTTGREAYDGGDDQCNLAEWSRRHLQQGGEPGDAVDPELRGSSHVDDMATVFELGILCTETSPSQRPSMKEVSRFLMRCKRA
ncbi:hypothetical protein C4D60_Mb08t27790 [Musa balbisiana]|uniref:Protein kinase domain-containing protein n=1 Tax=Musa balbisiana TaxID=52838 RepID=A0A4S8K6Z1_MUSBA|nr:hypothetical protein C4D60_Mb08t27790 [Musa balbisiana]